jgi:hypothetical protein
MQKNKKTTAVKSVKEVRYTNIIFVLAPDTPYTEVKALENHWKEAIGDPSYVVVTNYNVYTKQYCFNGASEFLAVTAPDVPISEVLKLRKKVDRAIAKSTKQQKPAFVFANYDVYAETRPADGIVIH